MFNITGTVVNYFVHCKRQCYLFYYKIQMEDESELVKIGRALHEAKHTEEILIDNIKVDKIKGDYLIELKKSDADLKAAEAQLLYYLFVLKNKGIIKKGKIEVIEKNKQNHKTIEIILDEEKEKQLKELLEKIKKLLAGKEVPRVKKDNKCKKCAYYSYCYI
ncbi:CRISPR-associated protein Cas4 [Fusobacterium sp.]|uniref:CRISPR-associated protein Cas4 n=1 Tax=Fusobacterium sp. TaxID=68766 RepID=UPI00396C60E0